MKCDLGATYASGCRCDFCRNMAQKHMDKYRKREAARAHGHTYEIDLVNPEEACKLIWDAWSVRGLTFRQIGIMCGLEKETIRFIYHQKSKRIKRITRDKIIKGLSPGTRIVHDDGTLVDAAPHRWMLRCLVAQGWRFSDLEDILREHDRPCGWVRNLREAKQTHYSTTKQIRWLADYIGDRHGTSSQSASRMRQRGIFPLIHYTENGKLIVSSLTEDQKELYRRVQSSHGKSSSSGDGS